MSRLAVIVLAFMVSSTSSAWAQQAPQQSKKPKPAVAPAKKPKPAAKSLHPSRVKLKQPAKRLDLFPSKVLESAAKGAKGKNERRPGLSLGSDGDWKVQAAQVGVMAATFGALVGLCGAGNCRLPDGLSSWLPDSLKAKAPPSVPLRRRPKLRKAR